jgi:hypothetical protein
VFPLIFIIDWLSSLLPAWNVDKFGFLAQSLNNPITFRCPLLQLYRLCLYFAMCVVMLFIADKCMIMLTVTVVFVLFVTFMCCEPAVTKCDDGTAREREVVWG